MSLFWIFQYSLYSMYNDKNDVETMHAFFQDMEVLSHKTLSSVVNMMIYEA